MILFYTYYEKIAHLKRTIAGKKSGTSTSLSWLLMWNNPYLILLIDVVIKYCTVASYKFLLSRSFFDAIENVPL
jgi:hypothetical protein